jgi:hypothetical protein
MTWGFASASRSSLYWDSLSDAYASSQHSANSSAPRSRFWNRFPIPCFDAFFSATSAAAALYDVDVNALERRFECGRDVFDPVAQRLERALALGRTRLRVGELVLDVVLIARWSRACAVWRTSSLRGDLLSFTAPRSGRVRGRGRVVGSL